MKNGQHSTKLFLIIPGLILGLLIYLGPSIILSILVLWSIFSFLAKRPQGEKSALTTIVIIALALRLIFFTVVMYIVYCANLDISKYPVKIVGDTIQVVRDFDREIKNGIAISQYLKGEFGNIPVKGVSHHGVGFLHAGAWTQGVLDYLFGFSVFNLLLFPLLDLWSVIIVYYLGKKIFDERVASFASFIYAVMPSAVVISCTNIRFSLSILSLLLIAFSLYKFATHNSLKSLLSLAVSLILFSTFREKASKPLLLILPLILFLAFDIRFRIKFVLLTTLAIFFFVLSIKSVFIQQKSLEILQNVIVSQAGFSVEVAEGEYSDYRIYEQVVYSIDIKKIPPLTLLKVLPKGLFKGLVYFMFVPFPWEVTSTARLYYYPQVIFWYFIIPFAIFGIIKSLLLKTKETLPVIMLCAYFIVLLSLVLGNEGIAARYRELITPFFYIFAGSILCKFFAPSEMKEHKVR